MARQRYRVVFQERPTEVFSASGYQEDGGMVEFFDADLDDEEARGTRVFTRSSIVEITPVDG